MFATLLTIALFATSAIPGVLGDFTISTPQNVTQVGFTAQNLLDTLTFGRVALYTSLGQVGQVLSI